MTPKALLRALMALMLGCLCAQAQTSHPQVHGTITEPGSNQPVVDATITVKLRPEPAPKILINGGYSTDAYLTTKSGNDGSFSFEIERYGVISVKVSKDGYRGAAMFEPPIDQAELTLDADHPNRDISLHLTRPGAVTGRVVDEETRKPAAHVKLGAYQADYQGGSRRFLPVGAPVETDADGRFTIGNLTSANYVVAVRPQSQSDGRIVTRFEPADFEVIERDFERTWWPGGRDQDLAIPVPVASGQTFDIGQIAVRKAPLYRVKATLSSPSCAPGELVDVSHVIRAGFFTFGSNYDPVTCGEAFLMTGLAPGTYWIEARTSKRPLASTERASVPVEIKDKNVEVKAVMARGVDIDLRIIPTDGSRQEADWAGVRPLLRPYGRAPSLSEMPEPGGHLQLVNMEARDYFLSFANLPPGFYVKEVRYNGAVMPFGTLKVSGAAMAHKVEIVVDDKPASVTGKTEPGAIVILARWPITTPDPRTSYTAVHAGADGKYQALNLAPVEYRIFAMPVDAARKLDRPGVLDGLLQSAKKLTLSSNATHTQDLELLRPN
ncbi:MAG TPA: carboxypeptidase-like regulatory domain-containing protein [Candidatus Acidoferrum sp.]|jgi:hypothetical protein|nr:carboxypeptidase-like regulatory domain-containing protein [Candidatus Acidoferrum sp.]